MIILSGTKSSLFFRNFVPQGPEFKTKDLAFRPVTEEEFFACCRSVGNDWQTGAIYCGNIASHVAEVPGGRVSLCREHPTEKNAEVRSEII